MKIVILCGGAGSRIAHETNKIPKPMIMVNRKPILIRIMEHYKKYGFDDFILACGYKFEIIQRYFKKNKRFKKVKIVNTGNKTLTGKRLYKLKKYLKNEENFMLTYGDGISSLNIKKLVKFHKKKNKYATVTAVNPPSAFGELIMKKNKVKKFNEKKRSKHNWINGGFFVFNIKIFKLLKNINSMLEDDLMSDLVKNKQLIAYKYLGFWKCLDTYKDKIELEKILKKNA